MTISFKLAVEEDATLIGNFVVELTQEICQLTNQQYFDLDSMETISRCRQLMHEGHYNAFIGFDHDKPIAVATITETYALYAGGKIGCIQEFYVAPDYRSSGVGAKLMKQVQRYGEQQGWSSLELCTPPLPEFERTLNFYQNNGLKAVGGRKMRQYLTHS